MHIKSIKIKVLSAIIFCSFLLIGLIFSLKSYNKNKFIIITDLEPDDRIALHLMKGHLATSRDELLFVGTTVKNAARKKALTRKLLDQLGLNTIPVYQGSGGTAESYYDIASSRAAREYSQEGENILPEAELNRLHSADYSSQELQEHIETALENNHDVQFIMLAPPSDLVAVLEKNPALKRNIKHIHIMGGWSEAQEQGQNVLRTTYNWNMDPRASAQLMSMNDIPMTLYSSHSIKEFFNGGSCNIDNCKSVIQRMSTMKSYLPSLEDQEIAALSWDEHIMAKLPLLKDLIAPYKGKQFTPADPLVIGGIINHNLIRETEAVDIRIDLNDLDKAKGFRVYVTPNSCSKIKLVTEIALGVFKNAMIYSLYYC